MKGRGLVIVLILTATSFAVLLYLKELNSFLSSINNTSRSTSAMNLPSPSDKERVSCGIHLASSCEECPRNPDLEGSAYCFGDCYWNKTSRECMIKPPNLVRCGSYYNLSCDKCPVDDCNGDCQWNNSTGECILVDQFPLKRTNYAVVTEEQVTYLHELLTIVSQLFEKHNVHYWLDGGTLLGAIRNRPPGMLRFDDDLDIAVRISDYAKMHKVLSKDERLDSIFKNAWGGFAYGLSSYSSSSSYEKYRLDIFPYRLIKEKKDNRPSRHWYAWDSFKNKKHFRQCYYEDYQVQNTWPCQFWDLTLQCPTDPMQIITQCYGSSVLHSANVYSHADKKKTSFWINLDDENINDHTAFLPGLNKYLRDKLLPNPNIPHVYDGNSQADRSSS